MPHWFSHAFPMMLCTTWIHTRLSSIPRSSSSCHLFDHCGKFDSLLGCLQVSYEEKLNQGLYDCSFTWLVITDPPFSLAAPSIVFSLSEKFWCLMKFDSVCVLKDGMVWRSFQTHSAECCAGGFTRAACLLYFDWTWVALSDKSGFIRTLDCNLQLISHFHLYVMAVHTSSFILPSICTGRVAQMIPLLICQSSGYLGNNLNQGLKNSLGAKLTFVWDL